VRLDSTYLGVLVVLGAGDMKVGNCKVISVDGNGIRHPVNYDSSRVIAVTFEDQIAFSRVHWKVGKGKFTRSLMGTYR